MSAPISRASSTRVEVTIGFIDLEGFTAHTEEHGDEDAAELATSFAEVTRAALGPSDRLVKTLGDAVLVTSADPASGLVLVERLLTRCAENPRFPNLRAGLHHGPVVLRDGDVFGAAVNLAARVASEAHGGEVLGTEPIAAAARESGIEVIDLGTVSLKNVRGSIPLFSLALMIGASDSVIDPVCHAVVDRRGAIGKLRHRDVEYFFCSLACAATFASNPSWHVASAAPG